MFIFLVDECWRNAIPLARSQEIEIATEPVLSFGEGDHPNLNNIDYLSLTSMILTLAECFETGAYYLEPDGFVCSNEDEVSRIF